MSNKPKRQHRVDNYSCTCSSADWRARVYSVQKPGSADPKEGKSE